MRRGGGGHQLPGRDQCAPARSQLSPASGPLHLGRPGPRVLSPWFCLLTLSGQPVSHFQRALPQTCFKNDPLLFLSLPPLYFASSIHSLLPEMIFSSGSLTENFYKGKNPVLRAELGQDRCSKKMLAE